MLERNTSGAPNAPHPTAGRVYPQPDYNISMPQVSPNSSMTYVSRDSQNHRPVCSVSDAGLDYMAGGRSSKQAYNMSSCNSSTQNSHSEECMPTYKGQCTTVIGDPPIAVAVLPEHQSDSSQKYRDP
jgi:hypothetical protein